MASFARVLIPGSVVFAVIAWAVFIWGCTEPTGRAGAMTTPVKISGRTFHLEVAADDTVRIKGLGQRDHLEEDGGMLFVFPGKEKELEFVMRDCQFPIDVIFTDASGRAISLHAMQPEGVRQKDEGNPGEQSFKYESRLKKYSSGRPCVFAVEVPGGTIEKLGVKEGDKLEFDAQGLKAKAH